MTEQTTAELVEQVSAGISSVDDDGLAPVEAAHAALSVLQSRCEELEREETYWRERAVAAETQADEQGGMAERAEAEVQRLRELLREIAVGYQDVISQPDVDRILAFSEEPR